VKKLLVVDVGERMSAEEALGHRWIQESDDFACDRIWGEWRMIFLM